VFGFALQFYSAHGGGDGIHRLICSEAVGKFPFLRWFKTTPSPVGAGLLYMDGPHLSFRFQNSMDTVSMDHHPSVDNPIPWDFVLRFLKSRAAISASYCMTARLILW
jgi:hypothetical protein